ncbi:MAG: hypothetical protein DBY05_09670 [Clostridiales bacterium]|nr:MAG: hypothetical protein DBY05_09670 [Clostridiales bacterium]
MKKDIFYEAFHDKTDKVEFFQSAHDDTFVHFHRCIELIYVTDGAIDCEVGEEKFRAKKDELIFARKCAPHALAAAPDFVNYVLIIGQRYSDDFLGIFQTETLPAHLDDAEFNRSLLPHFEALNHLRDTDSELVKKGYINIIIGSLLAHYKRIPVPATPQMGVVLGALNYIDEHFAEPISLDSISSVFGYNKYYFSRLFNTYIGENLNNYINTVRIRNLVSAAKKTDNPNLSELVFGSGFDSMTTFYRSFSRLYDRSPTEVFKKD